MINLHESKTFCGFQYRAKRVYDLIVYFMAGAPEGLTESGYGEDAIEPATPGLQGIGLIHYTTAVPLHESMGPDRDLTMSVHTDYV